MLTDDDLAERWQVKLRKIREMRARRELPFVTIGRSPRYRLKDVEAFEAAHTVTAKRGPLAGKGMAS